MSEKLIIRAVTSAFQNLVDVGIEQPEVQLKTVERRLRTLSARDQETSPSLEFLIQTLARGLAFQLGNKQYVALLDELETQPQGGLVKKLSAKVDKKTNNPKTSLGSVWRRNSTVKERRRPSPNWKDGSTAKTEAKRKSSVKLFSYDAWIGVVEQQQGREREQIIEAVRGKKIKRGYRDLLQQEMERRMETTLSIEDLVANEVLATIKDLSEKNGLANEAELYRRIMISLRENQPLPILFVWGPPYEGQARDSELFIGDTPENKMSDEIEQILNKIRSSGIAIQPILLYADRYGIDINGMDPEEVQIYYDAVENRFSPTTKVMKWSEVRAQNMQRYFVLATEIASRTQEITIENIQNATLVQKKLGNSITVATATELARRYKIERMIEGQILTDGFEYQGERISEIIKLATAPSRSRNDEPYEAALPRFYIKNMTRAAWNKTRK